MTIHVDRKSVLRVNSVSREFREYPLPGETEWAQELQDAFRKLVSDG